MIEVKANVKISRNPIVPGSIFREVIDKRSGGLVFFIGTVRSTSRGMRVRELYLESAEDIARNDLERICSEAEKKFSINDIVVIHRIGKLKVGDIIVAIAVGAAHRKSAFRACEFIIDELKKTTPIWKKEIGYGRERWV